MKLNLISPSHIKLFNHSSLSDAAAEVQKVIFLR